MPHAIRLRCGLATQMPAASLRSGPRAACGTETLVGVCLIVAINVNIVDAKDTSILGREGTMMPFAKHAQATANSESAYDTVPAQLLQLFWI